VAGKITKVAGKVTKAAGKVTKVAGKVTLVVGKVTKVTEKCPFAVNHHTIKKTVGYTFSTVCGAEIISISALFISFLFSF
jgi:hypothetical protein